MVSPRALFLLALLLGATGLCVAQSSPEQVRPERGERVRGERVERQERIERNRERWRHLSTDERNELRKVHRALRQLPEEKRAMLEERLRQLDPKRAERLMRHHRSFVRCQSPERDDLRFRHESFQRWRQGLSEEEQQRLENLSPEELRLELRERMETRLAKYRDTLSGTDRARFDALDHGEQFGELRRAHFAVLREKHRESLSDEERVRYDALTDREKSREAMKALRALPGGEREGGGPWGGGRARRPVRDELQPIHEVLRTLPRDAVRDFLRGGILPEGLVIEPELRERLGALTEAERQELLPSFGRPGPSRRGGGRR